MLFYSWSVKYVPWNPLHASHNLKGRLWSCTYLGTDEILSISRHWAQFWNYFQHLSVYSQALLSIISLLSALVFHVFNFEAFCKECTISWQALCTHWLFLLQKYLHIKILSCWWDECWRVYAYSSLIFLISNKTPS